VTSPHKYRSDGLRDAVIAFSIAFEEENLLARGMGFEHLSDLLIRLARILIREGADLAYGGNWEETPENFTYLLLRLIAAEQQDTSWSDQDARNSKLYNHLPWPHYLPVTAGIEAQWINSCRIVRVTQELAGIAKADIVPDAEAGSDSPQARFNAAVTLSAMRRLMMEGMTLDIPDVEPEIIRPVTARILLGGKAETYSGFMPGIFEEALVTMKRERPVYILGGFGGAAECLARAILGSGEDTLETLAIGWHRRRNPKLRALQEASRQFDFPAGAQSSESLFDELRALVVKARENPSEALNTGLSEEDTREMMTTRDVATAVRLVRDGLTSR
jgi:hypothetical protein